uniref:Peroxisomal membrane protein 4 n=2 Tax=Oxyrrhis marina TaxID=2969 RepID=A0A7S3UKD2_OXYMA
MAASIVAVTNTALEVLPPEVRAIAHAFMYATRIRLVDGLVKAVLYSNKTWSQEGESIIKLTWEHGSQLAAFACMYKAANRLVGAVTGGTTGGGHQVHAAVAGFLGGWMVWGRYSKFNETLNLYLYGRVLYALAQTAQARGYLPKSETLPAGSGYRWWSAIVWMIVMYQFERGQKKHPIQSSLYSSMDYLYHKSDGVGFQAWGAKLGRGAEIMPLAVIAVVLAKLRQ